MIASLHPIAAKAAPGASAPPGVSLLGLDFPSLLAPATEDGKAITPRQNSAEDGKDLPDDAADTLLAMIAATMSPTAPTGVGTPPATPATAATPPSDGPPCATSVAAPLAITLPETTVFTPLATPEPLAPVPAAVLGPPLTAATAALAKPSPLPAPARAKDVVAQPAIDVVIAPRTSVAPPALPAAQVVAAMTERPAPLLQGLTTPPRSAAIAPAPRTAERERGGEVRIDGSIQLPLVAAALESHRTMLDLRQEHWPQRMVEHIETLRDAADANDTRIRLVPDALGTVDVKLRRDGDTVHVAFTAERVETRVLLDQAQPKLTELGEARGLRFAHASTDAGSQTPQRQPAAPQLPTAPPRAATDQPPADDADDTRIA